MREIIYHKLFSKKLKQWNRNWSKNSQSILKTCCILITIFARLCSPLLQGEIKHKDVIQKKMNTIEIDTLKIAQNQWTQALGGGDLSRFQGKAGDFLC